MKIRTIINNLSSGPALTDAGRWSISDFILTGYGYSTIRLQSKIIKTDAGTSSSTMINIGNIAGLASILKQIVDIATLDFYFAMVKGYHYHYPNEPEYESGF